MDAILGFSVLHQLKPRANYLWILLEYFLGVPCSIERYLKLIRARYKVLVQVHANWLTTAHTRQFICHICHLVQPGRELSRIEVEDILDNRVLFSRNPVGSGDLELCCSDFLLCGRDRGVFWKSCVGAVQLCWVEKVWCSDWSFETCADWWCDVFQV
jgi:hypothetical protein